MNEHTRYRTGTADLKMDIQKRITELKSAAWDAENNKKYMTLLTLYRDTIGLQDALIAILTAENAENEDLANEHEFKLTE